jgi:hypothetical protein
VSGGNPSVYSWVWSDNTLNPISGTSVSRTFSTAGTTVTLSLSVVVGATTYNSAPKTVTVTGPAGPSAAFTITGATFSQFSGYSAKAGDVLTFQGSETQGNPQFAWTFGDGGSANGQSVTHQYSGQGTFQITLHVTNDNGSASNSLNVAISGQSYGCASSATTLCIDDQPGDKRFEVDVTYQTNQGNGSAGSGNAIPLTTLGVTQGGLFWFFAPNNPELFVKIIDNCSAFPAGDPNAGLNGIWVFASGTTNVGMTITVTDKKTGVQTTYTNQDHKKFDSIQQVPEPAFASSCQ